MTPATSDSLLLLLLPNLFLTTFPFGQHSRKKPVKMDEISTSILSRRSKIVVGKRPDPRLTIVHYKNILAEFLLIFQFNLWLTSLCWKWSKTIFWKKSSLSVETHFWLEAAAKCKPEETKIKIKTSISSTSIVLLLRSALVIVFSQCLASYSGTIADHFREKTCLTLFRSTLGSWENLHLSPSLLEKRTEKPTGSCWFLLCFWKLRHVRAKAANQNKNIKMTQNFYREIQTSKSKHLFQPLSKTTTNVIVVVVVVVVVIVVVVVFPSNHFAKITLAKSINC